MVCVLNHIEDIWLFLFGAIMIRIVRQHENSRQISYFAVAYIMNKYKKYFHNKDNLIIIEYKGIFI